MRSSVQDTYVVLTGHQQSPVRGIYCFKLFSKLGQDHDKISALCMLQWALESDFIYLLISILCLSTHTSIVLLSRLD